MVLLDNARIYRYDRKIRRFVRHRNLLIDDGRIAGLDVAGGATRIDMQGATVLPAFADCHVHLGEAGFTIGPHFLGDVDTYEAFAAAVARIPREFEIVYAGGYDESGWIDGKHADAAPLEAAHPDAIALLVRVDGHSCLANRRTLAWLDLPPDTGGIERGDDGKPDGRLTLDANWLAQKQFWERIPRSAMRASERRAAELARSRGIVHVHVQLLGRDRDGYAADVESLATLPIEAYPKICEPDASIAHDLGLPYVGGDVFLDGSIGSCTAAVSEPFLTGHGSGALHYSDAEVEAYLEGAERRGISAGVHAIGDVAIDQFVRMAERVLGGRPSPRGTHHFIEHFEIAQPGHIEACARMQLHLSMQPQFQSTWGGDGGMYDLRLGSRRRRAMNPIGAALRAGALVCGGSDAPVCAFDALTGMHAACTAQEPDSRIDAHQALALYTVNAAEFAKASNRTGNLEPGLHADLVVLDNDPLDGAPFAECRVLRTITKKGLAGGEALTFDL